MSSVFNGFPLETKPPNPRKDLRQPGDFISDVTNVFQLKLFRDINGAGASVPTISYAIGDNVDLAKQQSIHSTMKYLLDFSRENVGTLVPPTDANRQGYVASLPVGGTKVNISVLTISINTTVQETDLDQDAVNLVIYLFGPDSTQALATGAGIYYSVGKRLIELAREMDYSTVGQPRRNDPNVDDENELAGDATFAFPTWDEVAPQTVPDVLEWVVNLLPFSPPRDGSVDLVLTGLTAADHGNLYQVRAGYIKPGGTIPDSWRHSDAGELLPPV